MSYQWKILNAATTHSKLVFMQNSWHWHETIIIQIDITQFFSSQSHTLITVIWEKCTH